MPMAPAKPMQLVWAAVTRATAEGPVAGPQHKVPLDVALKAVTIDAAYSIQLEKRIGSIEVGKDANLSILEQSPYAVAPEKLKDVKVWGTMLEGRVQAVPAVAGKAGMAKKQAAAASTTRLAAGSRPPVTSASARTETRDEFWYRVNLTRSRIANEQGNCSDPGALIAGLAASMDGQLTAPRQRTHVVQASPL
jgi:hypothetical protein